MASPGRGQGPGKGRGFGRGRWGAESQRLGEGGFCVCPKCGWKTPHVAGEPCVQNRCAECGATLLREGSPHHQEVMSR